MCSITFFFENRVVYEIMRKNTVELDRPQMTIWCMRTACRMSTYTLPGCVVLIAFPLQHWLHESASMLCYTRGADKSLARPGRKQARKHVRDTRDFNKIETRAVIKFIFLQGKAPKEIHTILTETLACFLPGRAKDLSAPLYVTLTVLCPTSFVRSIYHITLKNIFAILVCFCLRLFECNSSRNKRGIFMKL